MEKLHYLAQIFDRNNVSLPKAEANRSTFYDILNMAFVIIGALAFLIIVVAGLRYILARGDPQKISDAKNTILFALIGLILAASAGAIVNFVLDRSP